MGGQDRGGPQRFQPVQGGKVVPERPVGVVQHGGAAAQDGVAGQHGAVRAVVGKVEADGIGGVAGRGQDPDFQARRPDGLAVQQRLPAAMAVGGVGRTDRGARQLMQRWPSRPCGPRGGA